MLLLFDVAYSLFSTCQETYPATNQSSHQNHCSAFGGLIPWIVGVSLSPLVVFLETYEHPLVAEFTIVLAVFTARLWFSTDQLFKATKQLVSGADKTAERQLRAYIHLDSEKIIEKLRVAVGEEPTYLLRFKNFGQTPAYKWSAFHGTAIGPWPPNFDFPTAQDRESTQVLPPGEVAFDGSSIDQPRGNTVTAENLLICGLAEGDFIFSVEFPMWTPSTIPDGQISPWQSCRPPIPIALTLDCSAVQNTMTQTSKRPPCRSQDSHDILFLSSTVYSPSHNGRG